MWNGLPADHIDRFQFIFQIPTFATIF